MKISLYNTIKKNKRWIKKLLPVKHLRRIQKKLIRVSASRYKSAPLKKKIFRGVNLIGDAQIEVGLGQSLRLIANSLNFTKYEFSIYNYEISETVRRDDHSWDYKLVNTLPYTVNLFHLNPPELMHFYFYKGDKYWKNHYNIGFWLWELEDIPKDHIPALKLVDEIWTPSEFTSNCYRKVTDKPVYTIPYHVIANADVGHTRSYFKLPDDKFLFLIMFDVNSSLSRKNPSSAIQAFKNAFENNCTDVGLVIKVNNATKEDIIYLNNLLAGYENIYFITETLDKTEVNGLIRCIDVFVSLHRAEGFGLVLAEAMLLKTACIATNWSANTEFMNPDVACMVPYKMKKITFEDNLYPEGYLWADPSIEETSKYMKKLKEDSMFYQQMVDRAYIHVSQVLGRDSIVAKLENRIDDVFKRIDV